MTRGEQRVGAVRQYATVQRGLGPSVRQIVSNLLHACTQYEKQLPNCTRRSN